MELGATVCVPREPRCLLCPVRVHCAAKKSGRERELPVVSSKPERPRIHQIAAIVRRNGGFVLARCAPEGLFAGLWEPPRVEAKDVHAARASLEALLGSKVTLSEAPVRTIEHVLTHRVLDVKVYEATLSKPPRTVGEAHRDRYDALEIVPLAGLSARGVSTLARKMLGVAKVNSPRSSASIADR
jgi:A/G-specific adenine glycosylase